MSGQTIVITGASRGLGKALAICYASKDVHLVLTAQDENNLADVKASCEDKGATVTRISLKLHDQKSIERAIDKVKAVSPTPDLIISNAGVFSGRHTDGSPETTTEQYAQIQANLLGTLHFLSPFLSDMEKSGRGQIGLVSSLAAFQPQPDSPTYSASKAGLAMWGKSVSEGLATPNVTISCIYPGHVETDQTKVHVGALPSLYSAEKAANIIKDGIEKRKKRIIFPYHLYLLICLSNLLPKPIRIFFNKPFRYTVQRQTTEPVPEKVDTIS